LHLVAVTHPDDGLVRHSREQAVGLLDADVSAAEFTALARLDLAAEQVAGQLHAVADAKHRDAEVEDSGVALRGARLVDARGAAGEEQAARPQLGDAGGRQVGAHDLAEDILLADAPGDQLAVLRAEVEDQDPFTFREWCHLPLPLSNLGNDRAYSVCT